MTMPLAALLPDDATRSAHPPCTQTDVFQFAKTQKEILTGDRVQILVAPLWSIPWKFRDLRQTVEISTENS